jgi:hypothetical protein
MEAKEASKSWASRVSDWVASRFSRKSSPPPKDGRPTRKQQSIAALRLRKQRFPVLNPAAVELGDRVQAFSRQNPYGRCDKCKKNTHNTEDHDAVIALAKRKRAAKTAKRGIAKANAKAKANANAMFISPFICLDEGMRRAFDEDVFDRAWKSVKGCINVVHDRHPGLYGVFTRAGEEIRESDGTQRVYRDDWHTQWKGRMGCCPEEVKDIARDMVQEFMEKGVTTRFAFGQGIEFLYYSICYAVIRLYLDTLEWENVHTSGVLDGCMDTHGMLGVKTNGERLVMFIVANDPICKTLRLGKYLSRVVDAVRHEGDAVRHEGEAVRQEGEAVRQEGEGDEQEMD